MRNGVPGSSPKVIMLWPSNTSQLRAFRDSQWKHKALFRRVSYMSPSFTADSQRTVLRSSGDGAALRTTLRLSLAIDDVARCIK